MGELVAANSHRHRELQGVRPRGIGTALCKSRSTVVSVIMQAIRQTATFAGTPSASEKSPYQEHHAPGALHIRDYDKPSITPRCLALSRIYFCFGAACSR
jgi:hypothetical protein